MKKLLFVLICIFSILLSCCTEKNSVSENISNNDAQNFFDNEMRHSTVYDKNGHELILHEYGLRGYNYYSFSIEHSTTCKKCYEIFD